MYGMVQLDDEVEISVERVGRVAHSGMVLEVTSRIDGNIVSRGTAIVRAPKSAFVYPGQGIQQQGMVLDERAKSPAAREVWERADKVTREKLGFSILAVVRDNPKELTANGVTYRHPEGLIMATMLGGISADFLWVLHQTGLAMHDGRRVAHCGTEHFGQCLHAEAHAEHGLGLLRAQANHAFAGTGIGRSARAGRNKHAVVFVDHIGFARIDRIVAHHRHRGTQRLQIADNRVNERIVVVHDQNTCGIGHHAPINV